MTKILAFSGKKQSGKSTSSNFIHGYQLRAFRVIDNFAITEAGDLLITTDEEGSYGLLDVNRIDPQFAEWAGYNMWPYIKKYSLATPLKLMAIELFGINYEQVFGTDKQKNEKVSHLLWENMPGITTTNIFSHGYLDAGCEAFGVTFHEPGPMTAREFLQFFGTEICRKIHSDIWAERLVKDIELESSLLAVVDDVRFENEIDLIKSAGGKVIRLTREPYSDSHSSETELDGYEGFDGVIENQDMTINETNQEIINLLEKWGWLGDEVEFTNVEEPSTGIHTIRS